MPTEEIPTPEAVQEEFASSYRDKRAILGQHSLEYIHQYCKLQEKFHLEFFHWLVSGEVYSYKTVENNEPYYEVVNVLDLDYDKDPDNQFIEDAEWVVRRKYMNPSSIVEFFYDDLGKNEQEIKDVINKIETLGSNTTVFSASAPNLYDRTGPQNVYNRLVEVKHVVWKSKKKVGICTFMDEFGVEQSIEVDETFKPLKELGQTVEWYWVNEIWEGYLIGTDMYFRIRPIPVQRTSLDNLSKCKLPYNGRVLSAINSRNISLVILGVPYQVLYNATFHRLKLAMAKMKDDMIQLDVNLKPKNMSLDEWLLYGDATNILFIDRNKEGFRESSTHQSVLRMASSTIQSYIELLRFIKSEWDEVCGVTRQRQGQINTSGGTRGGSGKSTMYGILLQYNLMIAGPDLRFYMGGGFHAGMWQKDKDKSQYLGTNGLDGVAGIEYTFARIPFSISVDVKPSLNYISGVTYFPNNNLGFGIRYVFGGWASVPDPKDGRE
jgi:hypothetical protein